MGYPYIPQFPIVHESGGSVRAYLVCEFCGGYEKAIPRNKSKVKSFLKPLDAVEVWGVQVPCSQTEINDILGCVHRDKNDIEEITKVQMFDDMKAWLSSMIGIPAPSWLEEDPLLKRKR